MMTRIQYLLGKLAEECNEVGQRAIKAQHFGTNETQQGQDFNNIERLNIELNDIYAIVEMINIEITHTTCEPLKQVRWMIEEKKIKVKKYYELSKTKGQVQ